MQIEAIILVYSWKQISLLTMKLLMLSCDIVLFWYTLLKLSIVRKTDIVRVIHRSKKATSTFQQRKVYHRNKNSETYTDFTA